MSLRRYTALANRSKLARHTSLNVRRATPRRSQRVIDPDHLARVRLLSCSADGLPGHGCRGPIVAHHAGRHPAGAKCSDLETIALCDLAHRELHDHSGCFRRWSRDQVRAFEDAWISRTQRRLGRAP